MGVDEAEYALEELSTIQESIEEERTLLEETKTARVTEQAALAEAKRDLSAYKEKTTNEVQQWVTDQQGRIHAREKAVKSREDAIKENDAKVRSERSKVAAAKRELKKAASQIARDQNQTRANLLRSDKLRREAETELKDLLTTRKQVEKRQSALTKEHELIAQTRAKIDEELAKAKKMSAEQREKLVSWEADLAARESRMKLAQDKIERDWLKLRSRENAVKAAIREYKLQGKV